MRLLIMLVSLPVAGLLAWWGISSPGDGNTVQTVTTHAVAREDFKVTLREKGELQASNSIDIKNEVEGKSTIISLVAEGTAVKEGDLLVELASDEIEDRVQSQRIDVANAESSFESAEVQFDILLDQNKSNILKAELKLRLAELELRKYEEGTWPQQENDAQLRVDEAKLVLERRKEEFENADKLVEKEYITKTEYEQDKFDYYKADVDYKKSLRDQEILAEFTRIKDKQKWESEAEEAKKELERVRKEADAKEKESGAKLKARKDELKPKKDRLGKLEEQLAKTKILAPAEGLVVYGDSRNRWWGDNDQVKEGATVYEQQTLMQLPDTSKMKVVIRIHEANTDKIQMGQKAVITVEGVSGKQYSGEITKIPVLADSQNRWLNPELKEYETEITLDQADPVLKPGVTAKVEILIAELNDVLAVPVQSIYSKGSKSFVFVGKNPNKAKHVEVEIGLASTDKVEIRAGVEEGQRVLLAVSEELKRQLPEIEIPTNFAKAGEENKPQAKRAEAHKAPSGDDNKSPAGSEGKGGGTKSVRGGSTG